jgi:hypothetical protein
MLKTTVLAALLVLALAGACRGGEPLEISVSGSLGYFVPLGDWTAHRFDNGVDQFQGGFTATPELELKVGDIAFGLIYSYTKLGTSDWEDFVAQQGDVLDATASLNQFAGVVRYYMVDGAANRLALEGGLSYVELGGSERYLGYEYEYDFLQSGLGYLVGAGFQHSFDERFAIVLPVRLLWRPEGVEYPEGKSNDVLGVLFQPGFKLTF